MTYTIGDFEKYEDRIANVGKGDISVAYYTITGYKSEDLKRSFDRTLEMHEWMIKEV